jgi:type IV fimbrial biogenesis protein FimT
MSTRQNTAGFTLLELMIVLAIGALIMSMAVPSFRNSINNQRLVTATNELVMSFTLAKSEAIKRVVYVSVCKSSDGASCTGGGTSWNEGWIVFANATTTNLGTFDVGDELIRVYSALPDSLEISAIGNVDAFVSFRPSGTLGTTAGNQLGTFTTCDHRGADSATAIVMQPSGRWQVSHDKDHDDTALTCS